MTSKGPPDQSNNMPATEEFKEQGTKHTLSKFEYDLYHEEDDVALPVIRVRHFAVPNKGDRWKIFEDNKIMFIVEGSKLNNKEKDFLKTGEGFNFLISQYKQGIKSFNALKKEIKKKIK